MGLPVRPWWWLPIAGMLVAGTAVLAAQSPAPADGAIRELVAEVRALRHAVERTSTLSARSQALLGRVHLQENRLADLGRRLDDARERTRAAAAHETKLAADLAEMTRRVEGSSVDERANVDAMLREGRTQVKIAQDQVAQLRADEQAVLTALTQEQTRWSDYNARLEAIEEDFVRPAPRQP